MATFIVLRLLPEDPASVFAGATADDTSRSIVAQQMGLDRSPGAQLLSFVWEALHGSLGRSWVTQHPVLDEIRSHAAVTIELVSAGLIISTVLGTLLGYAIAVSESSGLQNRRQPLVAIGKGFILTSGSTPEFWWGLVFIAIFFKLLGWVPAPFGVFSINVAPPPSITGFVWFDALVQGDWAALTDFSAHMVLPVITICFVLVGPIAKVVRESILPVMSSSYYTNLRTQGAGRWRMLRCVLRNGGAPVVMLLGRAVRPGPRRDGPCRDDLLDRRPFTPDRTVHPRSGLSDGRGLRRDDRSFLPSRVPSFRHYRRLAQSNVAETYVVAPRPVARRPDQPCITSRDQPRPGPMTRREA